MTPSTNPLTMLLDIFRSPSAAFLALYQRGVWGWQPFILLMISPLLFWGAYFSNVDFSWLSSELSAQITAMNPEQTVNLDEDTLLASAVINTVFNRFFGILLLALWFRAATKPSQQQIGIWKWFAASCAVMFPAVLGDFASYASLILNKGYVMTYAADLNSLNGLIKLPLTHEWSGFTSAFPLLMPWYIVIGYAAVLTWTEFERGQALVIAGLPWIGFFLIWAGYLIVT